MKKKFFIMIILFMLCPIFVDAQTRFLYDTIESELQNGYAREYDGEHKDSYTVEPSKKIYYWYGSNANQILEKNNVIFGDYCWKTYRTTDTGGVKMIYNGRPVDGKCTATGSATTLANSKFNNSDSLSSVGYMYNKSYTSSRKNAYSENVLNIGTLSDTWWYSQDINISGNYYRLVDPFKVSSNDYSSLVNHYTLTYTDGNSLRSAANYIVSVNDNKYYYYYLSGGKALSYYENVYTYGDTYIDNGDGTYTITNPAIVNSNEYNLKYSNLSNKYICKNAENNSCSELWYATTTSDTKITYYKVKEDYIFARDFTYENGVYTLSDDRVNIWNYSNSLSQIRSHHYTCLNETGECSSVYYVYYYDNYNIFYYKLSTGKSIEDIINDMLYVDDVNTKSSVIKTEIENWYRNNLTNYTDYIEDVIYCGSRRLRETDGFNPNGGTVTQWISFLDDLKCKYETDQYSVSNPKAKTTYPIGLMTYKEANMLPTNVINSGDAYWLMTPGFYYQYGAAARTVTNTGGTNTSHGVTDTVAIRPVISLKPKTRFASGNGSRDNPYIIDYNKYYNVDIEIKNETKELNISIEDLTSVSEGEEVIFKVTPIKGYKITNIEIKDDENNDVDFEETSNKNEYSFIMPAKDVTIIPSYEKVSNAVNVDNNDHTKEIKIQVNDSTAVVYEDEVIFRVDPEEGYELVKIEITDEEGNQIEYRKTNNENEYSFVMPDVDVTIKPIYKRIDVPNNNPKTGASLISLVVLMIIFGISIIFVKRKSKLIRD